jgi:L-rhamnose mutarotase
LEANETVKRIGFILKVKKDRIEEYKAHHKAVWPEMLTALQEAGWRNYSLFLRDDGLLFGYFETPGNLQTAQAAMATFEVNTRWQNLMASFFEIPESGHPDQLLIELEEVFHLD